MTQIYFTAAQQRLIDTGKVLVVDKHSLEIPESERTAVWRGFGGNFANKGLACTILRDDGVVLIVTEGDIDPGILRHEFVHAAQCFASEGVMTNALAGAQAIGRQLVSAIRQAIAEHPELAHSHRDLTTTEAQWTMQADGSAVVEAFPAFQIYQGLFPTKETSVLAAEVLGVDYKQGAYAAMSAYLAFECGYEIDPYSDLARELVAYSFERIDHECIDELLNDGAVALELAVAGRSNSY